MKNVFILFFLPLSLLSQIAVTDSFTDGDFTVNPLWVGDDTLFIVNQNFELQLNDTKAGQSYLSASSTITENASWEFLVKMDFNPSSSNYARVYLISDQSDLQASLNGYYVRLGGSSADRISLHRQTGNVSKTIAQSGDDWLDVATVNVRIQVAKDSLGLWTLAADTAGAANYQLLDTVTDNIHVMSSYFGLSCYYTTTRSDKFYIDDIYCQGKAFVDTVPASVIEIENITDKALEVVFNEGLDSITAIDVKNYEVDLGVGNPDTIILLANKRAFSLVFSSIIKNRQDYELIVSGVEDLFGNSTYDTVTFSRFMALPSDVIINELMVDPNPVVGIPPNALPEREYIELYNRSSFDVNLKNWQLKLGSTIEVLPDYTLTSGAYVIVTKDEGQNEFPSSLPLLPLDMSAVSLSNSGSTVSLFSENSTLINTVTYTDDWYADENKENGGWSLELIDPNSHCAGRENWKASESLIGGTPGNVNSVFGVNHDTIEPTMTRISILSDSSIKVLFSENLFDSVLGDANNYWIEPQLSIDSVTMSKGPNTSVSVHFAEVISPSVLYYLSIMNYPSDCSQNLMRADTLIFAIPQVPIHGEILINEILFNPYSGGSDFVELYNNSNRVFDLSKILMANVDSDFGTPTNSKFIADESFLFEPNRYLAITTDVGFLAKNYNVKVPENVIEPIEPLPTMNDDEGTIAIYTSDLQTQVDYVKYNSKMHLSSLNDENGVSLERVSFIEPSNDVSNWRSAASTASFATPGYINSQVYFQHQKGQINVDPKVFSPNQDGYNDFVAINYSFKQSNNIVSVSIWSSEGFEILKLVESETVGQEGFFTWDGFDDNGQQLNSGIYIVLIEYFNENGTAEVFKETVVLSL